MFFFLQTDPIFIGLSFPRILSNSFFSQDMSEREKLKAVQQAMKKGAKSDIPSKVYVVAGKGPTGSKKKGAKVKMVDSRMKSDTRGAKRATTKQKTGKAPKKKKGKGRQGRH